MNYWTIAKGYCHQSNSLCGTFGDHLDGQRQGWCRSWQCRWSGFLGSGCVGIAICWLGSRILWSLRLLVRSNLKSGSSVFFSWNLFQRICLFLGSSCGRFGPELFFGGFVLIDGWSILYGELILFALNCLLIGFSCLLINPFSVVERCSLNIFRWFNLCSLEMACSSFLENLHQQLLS